MKTSIKNLRAKLGQEMFSDPAFDGSPESYSKLGVDRQIELTNAMKAYIRENEDEFTDSQKEIANSPDISKTEKFGAGEAIDSFSTEFSKQAESIVEKSGITANKILVVAAIVSVAVGLTQLAPVIKSLSSKKGS